MKKIAGLILMLFSMSNCQSKPKTGTPSKEPVPQSTVICSSEDSSQIQFLLNRFEGHKKALIGMLVVELGQQFLDVPYVSQTLEHGAEEPLTVDLQGLDCTTFAETSLALARTIKSDQPGFEQYTKKLEQIRYRNGKRKSYPSRLHYFSDWIYDNHQKGLVSEPCEIFGDTIHFHVDFMSTHPNSYPVLKDHPELVPKIAKQEKAVSERTYYYLPKNKISANEDRLKDGDLVGIVTNIPGLDIAHVGILVRKNGHMHLLNASTLANKVVVSDVTLTDFLNRKKSYLGIMIARPVD